MANQCSSSTTSSLFSQPAHSSRASSRTAVVTPLEDFRASRYIHSEALAPVEMPRLNNLDNLSNTSAYSYKQPAHPDARQEPYGPYFSLPVDCVSGRVPLTRKSTTKELIGKYETLSSPAAFTRSSSNSACSKPSTLASPESREKKGKGRSPIRQSFRNILSVFSKKGRLSRDLSATLVPEYSSDGAPVSSLLSSPNRRLEPIHIPPVLPMNTSAELACNTPSSLYSGRLFYMSRPTSGGLPVWTDCSVLLHPSHILITWMTSHNNPSTSIITLARCTDVRSLTLADLNPEERNLLPATDEPNTLWVFELLFEGKAREKFAAASIKERAGWVPAIWDAVLRMSEEKISTPSIKALRDVTELETPLSSPMPPRTRNDRSFGENTSSKIAIKESELPPLPLPADDQPSQPQTPARITLYDPPLTKEATPSSGPAHFTPFRLSSPAQSRSQSPSIRNLDQKSMVKQRLAAIECSNSRLGSPTTPTEKSTRGRQIVRTLPESPTAGPKRSVLLRHGTITTIGGDSFTDVSVEGTPRSAVAESRRLVSIPSGESLGTDANPWSAASRMTTPEPLRRSNMSSVASHYSTDSAISERSSTSGRALYAGKELLEPVIPLEIARLGASSDDKGMPPRGNTGGPSQETVKSTRSLSIFSPVSPYSHGSVAMEQASAALNQLRDVERTLSPVSGIKAPLSPSPAPLPSPLSARSSSHTTAPRSPVDGAEIAQERTGVFSQASRSSLDAKLTDPTLATPTAPTQVLLKSLQIGRTNNIPISRTPEPKQMTIPTESRKPRSPSLTVADATLSVFHPFWQDTEIVSPVDRNPEAAVFSRFAKVLPELPLTADAPTLQNTLPSLESSESMCGRMNVDQSSLAQLEDKIGLVHADLKTLPQQLRALAMDRSSALPNATPQDSDTKKLLHDIDAGLKRVESSGDHQKESLGDINVKIDKLLSRQKAENSISAVSGLPSISGLPNAPEIGSLHASEIIAKLEEIRNDFKADLPLLAQNLGEFLSTQKSLETNSGGTTILADAAPTSLDETSPSTTADTAAIHAKLDEMLASLQAKLPESSPHEKEATHDESHLMLHQVLELLNSEKDERAKVVEQQADSARYLNELNAWLETFVNHGTFQIESVVGGVQQLCADLGATEGVGEDGKSAQHGGLISDIRQLLVDSKGREDSAMALQASVNGLMAAVHENLQQAAELRSAFNQEAVFNLIERQRQDQEHMLRALAHELSDDIRGERLRFVDAMKEATTINVQIHVEEFKKELTREVMLMTQEVDRLHKERQGLEQHIADLFAFYAKQKGAGERKKSKQRQPPQNAQAPQNVYYGVPGVPGFIGPAVGGS